MNLLRTCGRGLIGYAFMTLASGSFRDPEPRAKTADWLLGPMGQAIHDKAPALPSEPVALVKLNAGVMMGSAGLLALGKFPRLSALALAGSLVPTTIGGHAFWRIEDPQARKAQLSQFRKNAGLLGGLIFVALDRGGRPSLAWRAKYAREHAHR